MGTSVSPWWQEGDYKERKEFESCEDDWIAGRGLHSSTFRLNVSTFCGIRWMHDFPSV